MEALSSVIPLFKKGCRYDPLNYRPISLTPIPCKVLERFIAAKLTEYLETNNLLSPSQYGFRSNRSSLDHLILTYEKITCWLNDGSNCDVILFDFSKAFDTVSHVILLQKLNSIGISGGLLAWLESFLTGRLMQVSISGVKSKQLPVSSGVPQGSVLGPILFLIFVNSVGNGLGNKYKMFADDFKLYFKADTDQDLNSAQDDIDDFNEISASWGLKLNTSKCNVLHFNSHSSELNRSYLLNSQVISENNFPVDLGVTIDAKLKFHSHISNIVNKASGLSRNLLRSTTCRSPDFMVSLFISHIRPILDYCSPLWNVGYIGDMVLLERVQRSWTKHIQGMEHTNYSSRLRSLKLFSIKGRLLRADILYCWKTFHGLTRVEPGEIFAMAPLHTARGHNMKIYYPSVSSDTRKRFFSVRIIDRWNSLPSEIVETTDISMFKRKLENHLGDLLYEYLE